MQRGGSGRRGAGAAGVRARRISHQHVAMRRQRGVHSVKLLLVCILASTTFAFGFLAAVRPDTLAPPSPPPRVSPPQHQQAALSSVVPSAPADSGEVPATVRVDAGSLAAGGAPETSDGGGLRTATFTKILPFPFEQVLDYWENGPPDPNFIREDIVLQVNGAEEHRSKTIYTKNPLPWILRKTVRLPCLQFSVCVCAARASVPASGCSAVPLSEQRQTAPCHYRRNG